MEYYVYKFGGTSVGSAARFKALVPLISGHPQKIVVLSAMAGTTNALVAIAQALYEGKQEEAGKRIDQLEQQYSAVVAELYESPAGLEKAHQMLQNHFSYLRAFTLDMFTVHEEKAILAQGELISTALLYYYLEEQGIACSLMPALDFMRLTPDEEPDYDFISGKIKECVRKQPNKELIITQGYICRNAFGEVDNLKRGGSDFTATIIGAVLQSPEIQIWTDIDGMHNNDPRVVQPTFPITRISYDEAAELAYFGARILHPTCVLPAQKAGVPIRLLNTMKPEAQGTLISEHSSGRDFTAVAAKDGITAINIRSGRMLLAYGFLRAVFEVFERYRTPIDMITTSEVAVSLTIDKDDHLDDILADLQQFGTTEAERNQTIVCVVGDFGPQRQQLAFRILEALRTIPLRMISYGGSSHNVSVLISTEHKKEALQLLNEHLFLKHRR
ncbi:MAG: aspartate kinase [Bacteroidetes bacterium]|nr:aspartate kinase [Bacteroidota bacterium]